MPPIAELEASRTWRLLRMALPSRFRGDWGREILRTHLDARRGADAPVGPSFWWRVGADVVGTGIRLRTGSVASGTGLVVPLRPTIRGLLRSPGYALAVVGILTLGIGANLTMFTVLDRLFLSAPPHVEHPESLRRITLFGTTPFNPNEPTFSVALAYPDYRALERAAGIDAIAGFGHNTSTFVDGNEARRIEVELATASYFEMLGVEAALGRFYGPDEDRLGAPEAGVVLSHTFWMRQFGGDPAILGTRVEIGRGSYTVVGVAPRGFTGIDLAPVDAWLPFHPAMEHRSGDGWVDAQGWYLMQAAVRVASEPEAVSAAATAALLASRAGARGSDPDLRVMLTDIRAGRGPAPAAEVEVARFLALLAGLVLLISAANVGSLALARGVARRREVAVRTALGAGRLQLALEVVLETALLAAAAAGLSVGTAFILGRLLFRQLLPDMIGPGSVGGGLIVAALCFASAAVAVAGLAPALHNTRFDVMARLRSRNRGVGAGRVRHMLLVAQSALSVVILVAAGLFIRSARTAASVDLGVDPATVALSFETIDGTSFGSSVSRVVSDIVDQVRTLPGVEAVAPVTLSPFMGFWGLTVAASGQEALETTPEGPFVYGVGEGYFEVAGLTVVEGRALTDADDRPGAEPVAVVGARLAARLWPDRSPLGQCLITRPDADGASCTTVVGVASDFLTSVDATRPPHLLYLPPTHAGIGNAGAGTLLVRPAAGFDGADIARRVAALSPEIRLVTPRTMASLVEPQLRSWRLGASLLVGFGVLSLLVCAAGIYSALAFEVEQRRRELAIRMALGAQTRGVVGATVARNVRTLIVGGVLGGGGGIVAGWVGRALLFRVEPSDPWVMAGVAASLVAVGTLAAALPSWRATRVDPARALRAD